MSEEENIDKKLNGSEEIAVMKRRKAIKRVLLAGGGVVVASKAPEIWTKPITKSVILPAEGAPISFLKDA